jgi:hypothetical protein
MHFYYKRFYTIKRYLLIDEGYSEQFKRGEKSKYQLLVLIKFLGPSNKITKQIHYMNNVMNISGCPYMFSGHIISPLYVSINETYCN